MPQTRRARAFAALLFSTIVAGCGGGGGGMAPVPGPSPTPTLKPSFYFEASDGSLTDLAPYMQASPFPISIAKYPTVSFLVNNLGDLTTGSFIVYVPIDPCYASTTTVTSDTITLAQPAFPFACAPGTKSYLEFKVGATNDIVNYITTP